MYEPCDFLWHTGAPSTYGRGMNVLIKAVKPGVTASDVAPYELTEFTGGIFLVATADETDPEDIEQTVVGMYKWINGSEVFEYGDFPQKRNVQYARAGQRNRQSAGNCAAADISSAEIPR